MVSELESSPPFIFLIINLPVTSSVWIIKPFSSSFFSTALPTWTALHVQPPAAWGVTKSDSHCGAVCLTNHKIIDFHSGPHLFVQNEINCRIRVTMTHTPHIGYVIFDLHDYEDQSLLSLSETEIRDLLAGLPSSAMACLLKITSP